MLWQIMNFLPENPNLSCTSSWVPTTQWFAEIDEGERQGHISSNYYIRVSCYMEISYAHSLYAYYTETGQEKVVWELMMRDVICI